MIYWQKIPDEIMSASVEVRYNWIYSMHYKDRHPVTLEKLDEE